MRHLAVRRADSSHAGVIAEFGKQSFMDAYRDVVPEADLREYVDTAFAPHCIQREMSCARAVYFIHLDQPRVLTGYAKLVPATTRERPPAGREIELQRLYVTASARGSGIGTALARSCESVAATRGYDTLWLRVWIGNSRARELYRRWRYEVCGEQPYRVGTQQRRVVVMAKRISRVGGDQEG